MFRILFCASVQCSAIPLPNISTLCFSFSTFIRACPFRCARLLSFLCLCYPLHSRTLLFRVDSSLFDSLPWRLSWNRICTYLFRFRSGPSDSISLQFASLPFIFSAKLLCALPFLLLCMSDQIHIRSTHCRIFSHLLQSILLRFRAFLLSSFSLESCLCPASPSRCYSTPFRIVSCLCRFRSSRFWTLHLCCFSMFFRSATQLIVSLFLCISVLFCSYSIHFPASPFRRSLAHLTATPSLATSVLFPALSDLFVSTLFLCRTF